MSLSSEQKILRRREEENHLYEVIGKNIKLRRLPLKKQKAYKKEIRVSRADYTFLQYGFVIRKWAMRNHDLSSNQLDMLLYMYPLTIFSLNQFRDCQKELGMVSGKMFIDLFEKGWVSQWSRVGHKTYFVLSTKGNVLVSRMHRMYILEEKLPTCIRRNKIASSSNPKDKRLMEVLKEFNRKVREKG